MVGGNRDPSVRALWPVLALIAIAPIFAAAEDKAPVPISTPGTAPADAATSAPTSATAPYDSTADAKTQIADALARAKRDNQRVLIMWGGNWCPWCRKLHETFTTHPDISKFIRYEYQLVPVDIGKFNKHLDVAANYKVDDLKKVGVPFLTVLDADGKVLVNQETGALEEGKGHDPKKVLAFLGTWKTEALDAEKVLSAALAEAGKDKKSVLVHFGAPWCAWCRRLDVFLARKEIAEALNRDYIDVKIDVDRMKNGRDVQLRFRKTDRGGIPWMVILDAQGKALANSDSPKGNIGFPAGPEEIAHFIGMLQKGAKQASPDGFDVIKRALEAEGEKINAERKKP